MGKRDKAREAKTNCLYIYEPNGSGHRYEYVAQVSKAALDSTVKPVLLTTTKWASSIEFRQQLGHLGHQLQVTTSPKLFLAIRAVIERCHPVAILEADRAVMLIAARSIATLGARRARTFALIMRPPWATERRSSRVWFKGFAWAVLSHISGVRVSVLGDCFGEVAQHTPRRVKVLADKPVIRVGEQVRHGPIGSRTLLLAGVIDERKAPIEVTRAVLSLEGWNVRIIGAISPVIRPIVLDLQSTFPNRITLWDGYASNEQLDNAIAECDAVSVVLRTSVGSSGILGRAIFNGKPVLAVATNETVRRAVEAHGVGALAIEASVSALSDAMAELAVDFDSFELKATEAKQLIEATTDLGPAILKLTS